MGLKETIKKLCCSNGWSYGVFWHFDRRKSMLLTVEDTYCEQKMAALVNNMMLQVQMLGEGLVGQAALTGKNQWIFSDTHNGGWSSMAQDDQEIQCQFSSGLKTVAVIPIGSRGVIQFGSTKKILESAEFVHQTKRLFTEVENINGISFSDKSTSWNFENCDLNEWFDSFCNENITPICGGSCNKLMEIACTPTDFVQSSDLESDFQQGKIESLSLDSTYLNQKADFQQSGFSVDKSASEIPCSSTWSNHDSVLTSLESIESFKLDDFDTNCFDAHAFEWFASTPEGGTKSFEGLENSVQSSVITPLNEVGNNLNDYGVEDMCGKLMDWPKNLSSGHLATTSSSISFESQCVKPINWVQSSITDAYVPLKDSDCYKKLNPRLLAVTSSVSECASKLDVNSINGSKKGLFSELGLEELLNCSTNSSCITNSSIDDRFSNSKRRRLDNLSVEGLRIDDRYSINKNVLEKPKKNEPPKKASRKRAKPGECTRPRPKDRQLIQDRIKELKEIIPDSTKCSIDALLDRTFKYMLFLQDVTKYADTIKQVDEPKLIGEAKRKIPKASTKGRGATWAVEVGDQSMVCPIIVEDLTQPWLMRVEMICENRGFFLEMADAIRGIGLNVLKGEMKILEDKIWARFVVEAKTNITRIAVFWSLVQLLQLTSTTGIGTENQSMNNGSDPHLDTFKKPPLCFPICVAETLK